MYTIRHPFLSTLHKREDTALPLPRQSACQDYIAAMCSVLLLMYDILSLPGSLHQHKCILNLLSVQQNLHFSECLPLLKKYIWALFPLKSDMCFVSQTLYILRYPFINLLIPSHHTRSKSSALMIFFLLKRALALQ
jgi:hypothetical protein